MDQTKDTGDTLVQPVSKFKASKTPRIAPLIWLVSLVLAAVHPVLIMLGLPSWLLFLGVILYVIISCPSAWVTLWSWRHRVGNVWGFGLCVVVLQLFFILNTWLSVQIDGLLINILQSVLALLMLNLMLGGLGVVSLAWAWRKHAAWLLLATVGLCVQWGMLITRIWFSPDQLIDAWFSFAPQLFNLTPLMCAVSWMFGAGLGGAVLELIYGVKREIDT